MFQQRKNKNTLKIFFLLILKEFMTLITKELLNRKKGPQILHYLFSNILY